MFKKITAVTVFMLFSVSQSAHAAFLEVDWKTAGDQAILHAEDTGKYWLKLSETHNLSYNDVVAKLDTDFKGWRLPTQQEVRQIYQDLLVPFVVGQNNNFAHYGINSVQYNTILNYKNLMGQPTNNLNLSYIIGGYIQDNGAYQQLGVYMNEGGGYNGYTGFGTTSWFNQNTTFSNSGYFAATYVNTVAGTFLVADSSNIILSGDQSNIEAGDVYAPAASASFALLGLMAWRRRSAPGKASKP